MNTSEALDEVFRREHGRVLATLIRVLGDFDRAEEALHDAVTKALERWPRDGVPANPRAWLLRTARNRAVDGLRHERMRDEKQPMILAGMGPVPTPLDLLPASALRDDQLRLVFTCCHPALALEARVALTLRTLCGLSSDALARAFLVPRSTMQQRIVRAKKKITVAGIPYRVPEPDELPERLEGVLAVLYLVFNEGYAATEGAELQRQELMAEGLRLAAHLVELLPDHAELRALRALMTLHAARAPARTSASGELVTLEEQDRSLWDAEGIAHGLAELDKALALGGSGVYTTQAAIAALHAAAKRAEDTDWCQIMALYHRLLRIAPSPVVALNHAAASAMVHGPELGLALLEPLYDDPALAGFHLLPAARADLLRRLGRGEEALVAYAQALHLATNERERAYYRRRMGDLHG